MKKTHFVFAFLLFTPCLLLADGGVLIPRDKAQPDPKVLSLEEMEITIRIDNGDARIFVRQIFANHTNQIEEGNYIFALPSRATVSDFAVWDGPVRIPAVVLERKRAEEIYNQLKQQAIDPGLLQMGERGAGEAARSAILSARIVPIVPYGTKRLEFEYHESVPVENLKSYFAIPLRPDAYQAQVARHLSINYELHSAHAITNFQAAAKTFPLQIDQNTPHVVKGHFEGQNVNLTEDFVTAFELDRAGSDTLQVLAFRNPVSGQPSPTETAPVRSTNEPGFFSVDALLGSGKQAPPVGGNVTQDPGQAKAIVLLFDTSLSMQWEKLERRARSPTCLVSATMQTCRYCACLRGKTECSSRFSLLSRWSSSSIPSSQKSGEARWDSCGWMFRRTPASMPSIPCKTRLFRDHWRRGWGAIRNQSKTRVLRFTA